MAKAARYVANHPDKVEQGLRSFLKVFAKRHSIAITGYEGAGKTVLFDCLTGEAFLPNYTPPSRSLGKGEQGKLTEAGTKLALRVVPGAKDPARTQELLRDIFMGKEKKRPTGVVHLVNHGYYAIRDRHAQERQKASSGTFEEFHKQMLKVELDDFRDTATFIKSSLANTNRPAWLLIAVNKMDLFCETSNDVERYYSKHHDSDFTKEVRALQSEVGKGRMVWDSVPISCWITPYVWNDHVVRPGFGIDTRNGLVARLREKIVRYTDAHTGR